VARWWRRKGSCSLRQHSFHNVELQLASALSMTRMGEASYVGNDNGHMTSLRQYEYCLPILHALHVTLGLAWRASNLQPPKRHLHLHTITVDISQHNTTQSGIGSVFVSCCSQHIPTSSISLYSTKSTLNSAALLANHTRLK
jgi:hypothetical protein